MRKMTDDQLETIKEIVKILGEAEKEFPLGEEEAVRLLEEPITANHMHPLTVLSHVLLDKFTDVDEPFMLTGVERSEKTGKLCTASSHCFYATIKYEFYGILVFWNPAGGMCPETTDNLVAFLKYPRYLKERMPGLMELAEYWGKQRTMEYEEPLDAYKMQAPEWKAPEDREPRPRRDDSDVGLGR